MLLGCVDREIDFSDLAFAGLFGITANPSSRGSNWTDLNARRHLI